MVSDPSKTTVEDVIIEIDRRSGSIIKSWDLNQSLDNSRRAWTTDLYDMTFDWFHGNGLYYDADDNSIVVSGRTQGVVKLTEDNEAVWILAPHRDWNLSGHGSDLTTKLLQPLDGSNVPITDPLVLDGSESHPEFQWAWYQHSPIIMPDGNIMVFDNGENRNYTGNEVYSRAVVFDINETNMSVRQVWDYGQARGGETFSKIVSKVNYYESSNTVLFCPGAVQKGASKTNVGKVIEVDYSTGQVVFEATITPPLASFSITFHSVSRMPIYP
jgi:arylsulfate sulfotransferase